MTDTTPPPKFANGAHLAFHGPMSPDRVARLIADLTANLNANLTTGTPATVVDYGCGWGELLLRVLEAAPGATGVGLDIHAPDIVRARANASARGLADRVTFVEGPAADHTEPADVVLNLGAYHALGTKEEALAELRKRVKPGGRLLFAAEFWERTPTEQQLAAMWPGTTIDECVYLPELVDLALAAGFRPLNIETATQAEWDVFESGLLRDLEEWLLANGDHPEAPEVRRKLDDHLSIWLRGLYGVFGYAFLTLGVPSA